MIAQDEASPDPAQRVLRRLDLWLLLGFWALHALPLVLAGERWGVWDADPLLTMAEVERHVVLEHREIPTWNPSVAGGVPVLQHPSSSLWAPDFWLLVLPFGIPVGVQWLLAFRLALALAGTWVLARRLGLDRLGSTLAAVCFMGSGAVVTHLAFGHLNWSPAAYLPWVLLCLREASTHRSLRWAVASALGLALVYTSGGIYPLFGFGLFCLPWILLEAARGPDGRRGALVLLGCLALSVPPMALKLLPAIELQEVNPRRLPPSIRLFHGYQAEGPFLVLRGLRRIFLERKYEEGLDPQMIQEARDLQAPMTQERGFLRVRLFQDINFDAYIGWIPFLVAFLAFAWRGPPEWRGWGLGFAFLTVLALSDPIELRLGFSPWQGLRHLPVLGSLRTAGRFLVVAALPLALFAGAGASWLASRQHFRLGPTFHGRHLAMLCVAVAALDLGVRNWPLVGLTFSTPPVPVSEAGPFETLRYPIGGSDLATFRAGKGSRLGHDNLRLGRHVTPIDDPAYRGEAYLEPTEAGRVVAFRWLTPHRAEVEMEVESDAQLVLNQNFLPGWRRLDREAETTSREGRVATSVRPGDRLVVLEYRPATLDAGLWISGLSLALYSLVLLWPRRPTLTTQDV